MKNFLYTLFALVLCCVILPSCHEEEVSYTQTPNFKKIYLTKADFKARLIPLDNGSSRISFLDDAMKRKVDSVLCSAGLGPNRLNVLQNTEEAAIDRDFSVSVEQVECEFSAMNLLGKLRVYGRELGQYKSDSTLELCYQKNFGDESDITILGSGSSDSAPPYVDGIIEEFYQDPFSDWSDPKRIEVTVVFDWDEGYDEEMLRIYSGQPYSPEGHIMSCIRVHRGENKFSVEVPKAVVVLYFLIRFDFGYDLCRPAMIENGACCIELRTE